MVSLGNKKSVDVAYIDFFRAFDSVVYSKLFIKLASYGFNYELLAWLKSFLADRTQSFSVDGAFSEFVRVLSGVPQGSVLAPLLFILYVNDIADLIDPSSSCKLFADDVKLYSNIDLLNSFNPLTSSLAKLETWSKIWQLRVNSSKCSILHLGLHNSDTTYSFNNLPLPASKSVCDFGVTFNQKL